MAAAEEEGYKKNGKVEEESEEVDKEMEEVVVVEEENFSMKNLTAPSNELFENLAPFTPSCGIDDLEAMI